MDDFKGILISIKPKWCELIASGKKTVEVRKARPKTATPFKCYIYCTKDFYRKGDGYFQGKCCGKVIGEFVCDKITEFYPTMDLNRLTSNHISDLVIYDEPKDIDVFKKPCLHDCKNCEYWYSGSPIDYEPPYCEWEDCVITRPPQSWCYVEEAYNG